MGNINPTVLAAMIAASAAIGTALFALMAAAINARVARQNAILSAQIAQRTKRAEFRQAWINQLRDSISKCQTALFDSKGVDREGMESGLKVLLLMNRGDPNYEGLRVCIHTILTETDATKRDHAHIKMIEISQDILREEWNVVKNEINHFEKDAKLIK